MVIDSTTIISTLQADGSGNAEIIFNMAKIKITKEELEDLYWNLELSTRDIANKLGVGQTTIRRWLAKYDIKTRTSKEAKQTSVYLEKQEELAERYRIEYVKDYIKFCEHCGKTIDENGKNMDVHHIKPYKSFENPEEANQLDNLVSLCHCCHRFVHSNSNIDKIYIK